MIGREETWKESLLELSAQFSSKSMAQVNLKWLIMNEIGVIPRSKSIIHLTENIDLFSFTLSNDDLDVLTVGNEDRIYRKKFDRRRLNDDEEIKSEL